MKQEGLAADGVSEVDLHRVCAEEIPELLRIANLQLGAGYLHAADLHDEGPCIAFSASRDGHPLGFCSARIQLASELIARLEPFATEENLALGSLLSLLRHVHEVGYLASAAILPGFTHRGLGTALAQHCLSELASRGVKLVTATAWRSVAGINAERLLHRLGFIERAVIPNFWTEASIREGFSCPACGSPPCVCDAVVYTSQV